MTIHYCARIIKNGNNIVFIIKNYDHFGQAKQNKFNSFEGEILR